MELPFYRPVTTTEKVIPQSILYGSTPMPSRNYTSDLQEKLILHEKGQLLTQPEQQVLTLYGDIIPHGNINWKLYQDIYERVPIVANAVNNTANFALQAGFELDASKHSKDKILSFFDKHNFELIMLNIFKQMQIYGNSYLEVKGMKLLPPHTMYVEVEKGGRNDGVLKGYKQIVNIAAHKVIPFRKDEIVHFKWNDTTNPFYGMSDLRPILGTLTRYMNWSDDLGHILHRFAQPFLWHSLGTEETPATRAQIDDYISSLQNRPVGEDWVTTSAVEIEAVGTRQKMMQVDGLVKSVENQLIGGLQIPALFMRGGESTNKATADVELQVFDRKVKALQTVVAMQIEDYLLPKIADGKVKIVWNEFSAEGELTRAQRLQLLTASGVRIDIALQMVGLGTWTDDVKKASEEMKEEQMAQQQQLLQQKTSLKNPNQKTDTQKQNTDQKQKIKERK